MAHPQLIRRTDRRAVLAAGTVAAAALLIAPAAEAAPLGLSLDCSLEAVADNPARHEQCAEAGLLSSLGSVLPEPVQSVTDPIGKVVDDVLKQAPVVGETVDKVPAVVDDVVESLPVAPAPVVPPLPDVVPDPPVGDLGPADAPATVRPRGPLQGPGIAQPPFLRGHVAPSVTTTRPPTHPFVAPVVSGPYFGDLGRLAEDFVSSRSPVVSSTVDALRGLGGSQTNTAPGPDAASWLIATASGMLLLLAASHLVHARRRYAASVAR